MIAEHRLERVVQYADRVACSARRRHGACTATRRRCWPTSPVAPPVVRARPARRLVAAAAVGPRRPAAGRPAARRARRPVASATRPPHARPPRPADRAAARAASPCATATPSRSRDVDLDLRAGEVVASMGRNGSGKSSLLWALQGSGPRRAGTVDVDGQDPRRLAAAPGPALVGLVPQTPADLLYLDTVATSARQADRDAGRPAGTCRGPARRRSRPASATTHHPRDLSEGQRLALVLAVQLAARPPVVLLDEPTRGLDYAAKARWRRRFDELRAEGRAVVVATHDVEFVAARRRPGRGAGRRRGRRRRADRRRARGLTGLRPAGREDPAPAPGSPSTRSRAALDAMAERPAEAAGSAARPDHAAVAHRQRSVVALAIASRRRGRRVRVAVLSPRRDRVSARATDRAAAVRRAHAAGAGRRVRRSSPTAGSTRRPSPCSACCPRSAPPSARWAPAPPASRRCSSCSSSAGRVVGPGFGFSLGCTTLFASALLTGGRRAVAAVPDARRAPWVGLGAGLLPRARAAARRSRCSPRTARSSAFFYGFMLNLSFWPFALGDDTALSLRARSAGHRATCTASSSSTRRRRSVGTPGGRSPTWS